jgi:hypothetical protein
MYVAAVQEFDLLCRGAVSHMKISFPFSRRLTREGAFFRPFWRYYITLRI